MKLELPMNSENTKDTRKKIFITERLYAAHEAMKKLHGPAWSDIVAEYRPHIEDLMKVQKLSALQVVLPIAKGMSQDGKNPILILAVAVEITIANNQAEASPDEL